MPDEINEQQIIETATSFGTGNVSCLILSIMGKDRDVIKTKPHPIRKIHRELQNRKIMEVASVLKYIISIYKHFDISAHLLAQVNTGLSIQTPNQLPNSIKSLP